VALEKNTARATWQRLKIAFSKVVSCRNSAGSVDPIRATAAAQPGG